jgi:enoyl-CoA hydratase/carnithine racemase
MGIARINEEVRGHVGLLEFSNPPHNHATVGLLRDLADALERMDSAPVVRTIVLTSAGNIFCAGADLVSSDGFGADGDDPLREFYDQVIRLFRSRKPIIAAIQGAAIGAGLGLAVAADFRVAAPEARFSANFVKLGFHPGFGLTHTLPRLIGPQHAARMLMTGGRYKPEEVAPWGLVDRIADVSNLRHAALSFAEEIAENAPLSLLATRASLRGNIATMVEQTLAHEHIEQTKLKATEDYAEGVKAVAERRPGQFVGR